MKCEARERLEEAVLTGTATEERGTRNEAVR
ncbi:MAG: hypothetical protein UX58_C0004G0067 [Candidatus Wolfebacteria bacterium GW2011_GWB2_46_69]|nr:MAG: hypothetical protein UX58_C0004G0067 [Candidatus Wolfebacteria bacterium GW2011_GWB2_46_69]KKU54456.1 MAG: hypothetical protein UX76_C0002G0049 [Candidatus Wolfebacteria bacterium GW2011_GWC1_47_103]KKU59783.1 MAG: hypothetical protein UX83_C0002G0070 [Candidatus Wolfebacteria bacterium GW2011_GWE2_47_12]